MDRNLNLRLASAAATLLLLGLMGYMLMPSSGANQFMAMDQALRNARSWRSHLVMQEPGRSRETKMEFYCPDRIHVWNQMVNEVNGERKLEEHETIDIGGTIYLRGLRGWTAAPSFRDFSGACVLGPRAVDDQLGQLELVMRMGKIRDTGKRNVGGAECHDWTGSLPTAGGWRDAWVVCIGEGDLPLQVRTPDSSLITTYTDWNKPILISPPRQEEIVQPNRQEETP